MQKLLLAATALFSLLIVAIVVAANTDVLPFVLKRHTYFPSGEM